MLSNKRGMSDVVMTVIMIGLVLIAVGVVWVAVQGILNKNTSNIDVGQKCLGLGFEITSATCQEELGDDPSTEDPEIDFLLGYNCAIEIARSAGSSGESIDGIALSMGGVNESTIGGNIPVSRSFSGVSPTKPAKVDARFYMNKADGEKYFCPGITATANIA